MENFLFTFSIQREGSKAQMIDPPQKKKKKKVEIDQIASFSYAD